MSLSSLDHCSIQTVKLKETRDFYVNILGMVDGDRPDFRFPVRGCMWMVSLWCTLLGSILMIHPVSRPIPVVKWRPTY